MTPDDRYLEFLPRHAKESERLNYQHRLLTSNLGYLLHPIVEADLPASHARIADVATGTGIWMMDLAEQLPPDTAFDGMDYSDEQFPTATTATATSNNIHDHNKNNTDTNTNNNVRFAVVDAKGPLPDLYRAVFDVVHIRYLSGAMHSEAEWEAVARNCLAMLKPGGWLQWHEADFGQGAVALRTDARLRTPAFQEFLSTVVPRLSFLLWSSGRLGGLLSRVGFVDVLDEATSTDRVPETRIAYTAMTIGALKGMYVKFARDREELSDQDLETRFAAVDREIQQGAYFRADSHVYLGRKPM